MRVNGTLSYILGDHLGSSNITTDMDGVKTSEMEYKPWGEVRYSSGTSPTDLTYTGQYSYMDDFGLMFYNARWYDPALGRFAQADSMIPGGSPTAFDRYAYVLNNPIRYVDPSGNTPVSDYACGTQPWLPGCSQSDYISPLMVNIQSSKFLNSKGVGYDKEQAQYVTVYNNMVVSHNLCGPLALEVILEWFYPALPLDYIMDIVLSTYNHNQYSDKFDNGLTGAGIVYLVNNKFPPGWKAEYHSYSKISFIQWKLTIVHYYEAGAVVILSCWQDLSGSGLLVAWGKENGARHWITIVGYNDDFVWVYNPYRNATQKYTWQELWESNFVHDGKNEFHDILVIWPPKWKRINEPSPKYKWT